MHVCNIMERNLPIVDMTGQMCWLGATDSSPKQLHLRRSLASPWRPYSACPEYVPDYLIPGGSKGYATMQFLLTRGWKLVSSDEGERSVKELVEAGFR